MGYKGNIFQMKKWSCPKSLNMDINHEVFDSPVLLINFARLSE
jgi:hypothetical protein